MTIDVNILFVEDFADDAILVARRLGQRGLNVVYDIVDTPDDLVTALRDDRYDVVLCDFNVPGMGADLSLALIRQGAPHLPVIVVSGSIGEEQAADLMRAGARDIVLKSNLERLAPAIEREIAARGEQKRLIARADSLERQYREAFEHAPVPMAWVSLDGRYIRTNTALQELLGCSADKLSRMGPGDTVDPTHHKTIAGEIAQLRSDEVSQIQFESRHLHASGQPIWLLVNIAPVRNGDGSHAYWLTHMQNITARKVAEDQLFHAQKMEAIGNFAGGIAHDFNNMLVPIIGLADMMIDDLPQDSSLREDLGIVLDAAGKARALVRQILTFSRQDEISISRLDISACVSAGIGLLRNMLPTTIKLIDSIHRDAGFVMADPAQLQSIIMNLGSNAAGAIGDQVGELRIGLSRVHLGDRRTPRISALPKGEYVCLSVADSGCGMSESTLAKIFDPFFTTKNPGEGTGLGLAMVHGIVERYGGAIDLDSTIGSGTRFDIYLPIANPTHVGT